MCWFLLLQVPSNRLEQVRSNLPPDLTAHVVPNPKQAARADAPTTLHIVEGSCSCRLFRTEAASAEADELKRRQKYNKKGWSHAKIERAITQLHEAARHKPYWLGEGVRPDLRKAIAELAATVKPMKLTVKWTPEYEEIPTVMAQPGSKLRVSELLEDDKAIKEECLYQIASSAFSAPSATLR